MMIANPHAIPVSCNKDCGAGCPLLAYVENGRIIKITNNPVGTPYMKGCSKGFMAMEAARAKDRLLTPLIRTGSRGSGDFKEVSWVEALDHVAERLGTSKEKHRKKSVLFYSGRAIDPPGSVRDDYEIFCELSNRLGFSNGYSEGKTAEQCIDQFIDESEITDSPLFKQTGIYSGKDQMRIGLSAFFADPVKDPLQTPSGKVELASENYAKTGFQQSRYIWGRCVMANTDPKVTFLKLVDPEYLDADFTRDIGQIRMGHSSCRVNIALKGLPDIRFFPPGEGSCHRSDICIFPDIQGQEANYFAAATGHFPEEPRLEITIPSTLDDSLAPPGHHVTTVLAKYYPYELADGISWDDVKEDAADQIVDYIAKVMPNLKTLIVGRQMISTLDMEKIYGLTEGDIFHGRHDLDQILSMRPHPKAAQYRTPIQNLYLCGSGAHPGGGVTGAPGHNAARRVIADLKRR